MIINRRVLFVELPYLIDENFVFWRCALYACVCFKTESSAHIAVAWSSTTILQPVLLDIILICIAIKRFSLINIYLLNQQNYFII